jgi:NAD(P) transhydrogenase
MSSNHDLVVIGSGPAGQKAAIQAAKLGRTVALVERRELGGLSVNWGTIPSKTLREAIVYLTGLSQRATYGQSYCVKRRSRSKISACEPGASSTVKSTSSVTN